MKLVVFVASAGVVVGGSGDDGDELDCVFVEGAVSIEDEGDEGGVSFSCNCVISVEFLLRSFVEC